MMVVRLNNLRIVIGDGTLPLAHTSGPVFVDPNLLCARLLVQLSRGFYDVELGRLGQNETLIIPILPKKPSMSSSLAVGGRP